MTPEPTTEALIAELRDWSACAAREYRYNVRDLLDRAAARLEALAKREAMFDRLLNYVHFDRNENRYVVLEEAMRINERVPDLWPWFRRQMEQRNG